MYLCVCVCTFVNLPCVCMYLYVWMFVWMDVDGLLFNHSILSHSLQPAPWAAAHQASLSFTVSQSLLKLMFIESGMPSNQLTLYHPLLLPSIFPSIRVFSNELALWIR